MPPLRGTAEEKNSTLLDYGQTVDQLVEYKKKELEEVLNKINLANHQLAMLRDKIIKDSNEFESWKRSEKLKLSNDLNQRQNEIIANQNRINNEVQQQERITSDLRIQQDKFETLNQERIYLKEQLVKLEGKKIELADLEKQIESQRSSVLATQNQGSMALAKSSEEAEKNKQENIRLVNLNDDLTKRENKLLEDNKNLQSLKDFVEPKLRTIKDEQEAIDRDKKDNIEKIADLQQKISDEKILLQSVIDKKSQLDKDTKDFLSQKEEFQRQQILSGKK